MAELVYILCGVLSILCAYLLFKNYLNTKSNLLLWSGLCFAGIALNNMVLVVDLVFLPELDFNGQFWRSLIAAVAGFVMLGGLIWELS